MENTQTQKPFIIKDNLGAEVFSVDVDGTIFPAPVSGVASFQNGVPQSFGVQTAGGVDQVLTTGETRQAPFFLVKFDLSNPDVAGAEFIRGGHTFMQSEAKRDSGTSFCEIGWIRSTGGVFDTFGSSSSTTSASFSGLSDTSTFLILEKDTVSFGFGYWSGDGATECTFKNIVGGAEWYFFDVEGWNITQVIP